MTYTMILLVALTPLSLLLAQEVKVEGIPDNTEKSVTVQDGKSGVNIDIQIDLSALRAAPTPLLAPPPPPVAPTVERVETLDTTALLQRLDEQNALLREQNAIAERQARSQGKSNLLGLVNTGANVGQLVVDIITMGRVGNIRDTLRFTTTDSKPGTVVTVIQKVTSTANGGDSESVANGGDAVANGGNITLPRRGHK